MASIWVRGKLENARVGCWDMGDGFCGGGGSWLWLVSCLFI